MVVASLAASIVNKETEEDRDITTLQFHLLLNLTTVLIKFFFLSPTDGEVRSSNIIFIMLIICGVTQFYGR
jgi:hypothetical protein